MKCDTRSSMPTVRTQHPARHEPGGVQVRVGRGSSGVHPIAAAVLLRPSAGEVRACPPGERPGLRISGLRAPVGALVGRSQGGEQGYRKRRRPFCFGPSALGAGAARNARREHRAEPVRQMSLRSDGSYRCTAATDDLLRSLIPGVQIPGRRPTEALGPPGPDVVRPAARRQPRTPAPHLPSAAPRCAPPTPGALHVPH